MQKYAELLVNYSLYLKPGEKLYIKTTTLAEPLVKEIYKLAIKKGAHVTINLSIEDQDELFYENASNDQLKYIQPIEEHVFKNYDAYLYIRAPYPNRYTPSLEKRKIRSEATKEINQVYYTRTGNGSMKRSLCQYPTQYNAHLAGKSLEEYANFIFKSCKLNELDPMNSWQELSSKQEKYVNFLNQVDKIRYINPDSDISFSVKGRTWINSDGKTNMPSGEVFSSPIENSVNGSMLFHYPTIYMNTEFEKIKLWVKDGVVQKCEASLGLAELRKILELPGANRFGEVAIGTNYSIKEATKNILFDEKIGGTVHMALGQSYKQCGGKNESSIHWDLISDMSEGKIYADDKLIYENGQFLL